MAAETSAGKKRERLRKGGGGGYGEMVATTIDPVRSALDPVHYQGRGGPFVRLFVALIFVKIAVVVAIGFALLILFATGNL